jgi:hypothetical protein
LTILPGAGMLPGSRLRLLIALLQSRLSAMRSRRELVLETWTSAYNSSPWPGGDIPTSGPRSRGHRENQVNTYVHGRLHVLLH